MTLYLLTWEDVLSEVRHIEQYPLEVFTSPCEGKQSSILQQWLHEDCGI